MVDFLAHTFEITHRTLPGWLLVYLWIGTAYALFMAFLALYRDLVILRRFLMRLVWNTLILPVFLGLLWPVSVLLHLMYEVKGLHHIWLFRQLYGGSWRMRLYNDDEDL